ncbi:hypothetical protein U9M48_034625 [Paspalum notatum var. saurae]|uniref:Uncharacterized protein n=1 Tax=Paspalum notatum var. saurae TaxID=547442 RepID=A0AAQ3UD34_PASNO
MVIPPPPLVTNLSIPSTPPAGEVAGEGTHGVEGEEAADGVALPVVTRSSDVADGSGGDGASGGARCAPAGGDGPRGCPLGCGGRSLSVPVMVLAAALDVLLLVAAAPASVLSAAADAVSRCRQQGRFICTASACSTTAYPLHLGKMMNKK